MPTTSPVKIDFKYPVANPVTDKNDQPVKCNYDQAGFVRAFRLLAGSGKKFNVKIIPHNGRTKNEKGQLNVARIEVELTEDEKLTPEQASELIAREVPTVFPLIAKFVPSTPIRSAMTLDNAFDAWNDVTRETFFMNRGRFSDINEVEEMIVKQYRIAYNQDDTKLQFSGDLFSKIFKRAVPNVDGMSVDQRGREQAKVLYSIQENHSDLRKTVTSPGVALNGRTLEPLVKESQWSDIVQQSKRCYFSVTPGTGENGANEYRFSTISEGQTKPGRIAKVVGGTKSEYTAYQKQGTHPLYDRTKSASGVEIIATVKSTNALALKPNSDGFVPLATKKAERAPLTAEEQALVDLARQKFGNSKSIQLPKTDHGVLARVRILQADDLM